MASVSLHAAAPVEILAPAGLSGQTVAIQHQWSGVDLRLWLGAAPADPGQPADWILSGAGGQFDSLTISGQPTIWAWCGVASRVGVVPAL